MTWKCADVSLWLVWQILDELANSLFKLYEPPDRFLILRVQWVKDNSYKRKMARFCQDVEKEKHSWCMHACMCVHMVVSILLLKGVLTTGQEENSKQVISQLPALCRFSCLFPLKCLGLTTDIIFGWQSHLIYSTDLHWQCPAFHHIADASLYFFPCKASCLKYSSLCGSRMFISITWTVGFL